MIPLLCKKESNDEKLKYYIDQIWYLSFFYLSGRNSQKLELVSKELNHLAAILHVYAGINVQSPQSESTPRRLTLPKMLFNAFAIGRLRYNKTESLR